MVQVPLNADLTLDPHREGDFLFALIWVSVTPQEGDGGDDGSIYICTHCDMPSIEQVIEYSVCSNRYHYLCEGISKIEFEKHSVDEDSLYSCMSCSIG